MLDPNYDRHLKRCSHPTDRGVDIHHKLVLLRGYRIGHFVLRGIPAIHPFVEEPVEVLAREMLVDTLEIRGRGGAVPEAVAVRAQGLKERARCLPRRVAFDELRTLPLPGLTDDTDEEPSPPKKQAPRGRPAASKP